MNLHFSTHPGCWERHLQRQYNNPLFSHCLHPITQSEVDAAQRKDEQERLAFQQSFQALLQQVVTLAAQVEAEIVLKLKTQIDSLYEQCAGLGGDYQVQQQGLRQLSKLIMQSILESGIQEPKIIAELDQEEAARLLHFSLLEYPLIAHLLHPQSPITEANLVPTLLTEEEAPLRAAMRLFDLQQQQVLCQKARNLLTQLQINGFPLPEAWLRLSAMEQPE
jgi:hypothetical protein